MMKALVDKMSGVREESEVSSGMLYSTGLVAGGSLTGILIALLSGVGKTTEDGRTISLIQYIINSVGVKGWEDLGRGADLIGLAAFAVLCFLLLRAARQRLEA
jgi:hypothetical protein